jgi:hypothetical protein
MPHTRNFINIALFQLPSNLSSCRQLRIQICLFTFPFVSENFTPGLKLYDFEGDFNNIDRHT